jgi:hypothetical protein
VGTETAAPDGSGALQVPAGTAGFSSGSKSSFADYGLSALALVFEPNRGQFDPGVRYLARADGAVLYLRDRDFVLQLCQPGEAAETADCELMTMNLAGASPDAESSGLDPLPGVSNYLVGNSAESWHTGVPHFARVRYEQVYPGIDLVFHGNQGLLEYDFIVAPGVDPNIIRIGFAGAKEMAVDPGGRLVLSAGPGDIVQHAPVIYQEPQGVRAIVAGEYELLEDELVGFNVGPYDESLPLVIDPMLALSSYLGGTGADSGVSISLGPSGEIYLTGDTWTGDFPTKNALSPTYQGFRDGFVTKLTAEGDAILFSTYLGATNNDTCQDVAVDPQGNIYLTGFTSSTDFPTANAVYPTLSTAPDVFVAKLNPSGSTLLASSFLGGSSYDYGYSIALDSNGSVLLSGKTQSTDFPTANAYDGVLNDAYPNTNIDAYITKLPASLTSLTWSTFLGGTSADQAFGLAVDDAGNVYVVGKTQSGDFPTDNAAQPLAGGGVSDAFVTRIQENGAALIYSTYLGGGDDEEGLDIEVDRQRHAYVTAMSHSTDFPTVSAFQPSRGGDWDATVTEIATNGSLVFSTYLGAAAKDVGRAVAVDGAGNIYVAGETESSDFPTLLSLQTEHRGSRDGFVARFSPGGQRLIYSTYLGGTQSDYIWGITVDSEEALYLIGQTGSSDLPTFTALQPNHGGSNDAFFAKLTMPMDFFIATAALPVGPRLADDDR